MGTWFAASTGRAPCGAGVGGGPRRPDLLVLVKERRLQPAGLTHSPAVVALLAFRRRMFALALVDHGDAAILLAAVLTEEAVNACALVDVVRDVELGLGECALLVAESVLHTRPRRAATFDLRSLLWRRWRLASGCVRGQVHAFLSNKKNRAY